MNTMTRLAALAAGTALTAAILVGCANTPPSTVAADIQTIAAGLTTIEADLPAAGVTVPAATLAQVNAAIADLTTNANGIGAAAVVSPTTVAAIDQDVQLVATLLTPFFPASTVIGDLVEAGVSLIGTVVAEVSPAKAAAVSGRMSVAKARLVLKAAATN